MAFLNLRMPDNTEDLKTYYPTSVLLRLRHNFFLVARNDHDGAEFMDERLQDVYIHAL